MKQNIIGILAIDEYNTMAGYAGDGGLQGRAKADKGARLVSRAKC